MPLINTIKRHLINLPGWRTRRKLVVIESDDWGSIRTPSREVYQKCLQEGYPVDTIAYERYDSLLSRDDLELLFETLSSFKDSNGNHPIFTANCVVANPDFDRIEAGHFEQYYFESIIDTFKRYPNHEGNFQLWKEGIRSKVFYPQFHAREHLNVSRFMRDLRLGNSAAMWGFQNKMPGSITKDGSTRGNPYVEAMAYDSSADKHEKLEIYLHGLELFNDLFGYSSESIAPPNYIWSPDFDEAVHKKGVRFFQGNRTIKEPLADNKKRYHRHHLGQRNRWDQIYLVRNVLFEPSMHKLNIQDPVGNCLNEMQIAFRLGKPAILSSHRINYAGFIDERNRDKNILYLKEVFLRALERWPDIEFLSSNELGALIANED
jgi:hypothetical protein